MVERERKKLQICPYCRRPIHRSESQKDHIPPKNLFGSPRPKNLITVRCCRECHESLSVGDEVLKAMAAMGVVRTGSISAIRPEIDRALKHNTWWKKQLIEASKAARKVTISYGHREASGYQIGTSKEFDDAAKKTVHRTAVGLLFHLDPEWDATMHSFETIKFNEGTPKQFIEFLQSIAPFPHHVVLGDKAFVAAWRFASDSASHGVMVMSFFGGLNFAVVITPLGETH